jgi:hypothetical protein
VSAEKGTDCSKRPCKSYFLLKPDSGFVAMWDTVIMTLVIIYSCFTSAYYIAFGMSNSSWAQIAEHIVTSIYSIDIILKFMKIPVENLTFTHLQIAKKYAGGSQFYMDIVATFPFYAFGAYNTTLEELAPFLKLLRLTKLWLVMKIFYYKQWKPIIEFCFRAESKSRKDAVQMKLNGKVVFHILRLIIVTFIALYFMGCFWFVISKKQERSWLPNPTGKDQTFDDVFL